MRILAVVLVVLAWPAAALGAAAPPVPLAAYVVVDGSDGTVLASSSADAERPIASLTKMMTAYLAVNDGALDRTFTVPAAAAHVGESGVGLRPGERLSGRTLLDALLVPSANDAAETLAVGLAGSEAAFAARMNATARRLGMLRTSYRTPYGLDATGQYSTAADQLILARLLMSDRRIRAIVRQRSVTIHGVRFAASNALLGAYRGLDGVKTGHTSGAGWCLAASARRGGHRIFAVALGAADEPTRNAAVTALLDWGFQQFHPVLAVRGGDPAGAVPTSDGGEVPVIAAKPVVVTLRPGDRLGLRYEIASLAVLPLAAGAVEGRVVVSRNGVVIGSSPIVAAHAVAARGLADRIGAVFADFEDALLPG